MKFIDIILENSEAKESKLYSPAKKAVNNPETGITIQNKSAYHVIKDCAELTVKYLPHYIFGQYENPVKSLNGKFKKLDIAEFIKESEKDFVIKQLLDIILNNLEDHINSIKSKHNKDNSMDSTVTEPSDPYGEYGFSSQSEPVECSLTPLELLCNIFNVKS
jgi:hypothetical protein